MQSLSKQKLKKLGKIYIYIGVGIMLAYITVGVIAFSMLPEEVTKEWWFYKIFASAEEQIVEGHKYKVSIHDGIGTKDTLR